MSSLGNVGHHISVFHIDGTDNKKVPHIVNSCLAFIHSHLSSRDKFYIREKICTIFNLDQVKASREILYTTLDPKNKYNYLGPRSKSASDRDKIFDAYEGIYTKMMKLDADNTIPVFSVPSSELISLMQLQQVQEISHDSCDQKFKKMDERLSELHATFNNYVSIVSSTNPPPVKAPSKMVNKSIPPRTRNRLLSNVSKRSASEFSDDETSVPGDLVSDNEDGFIVPKKNRKKQRVNSSGHGSSQPIRRLESDKPNKGKESDATQGNNNTPLFSQVVKRLSSLPATKGTVKSTSTFRAAVPDIVFFNCHVKCSENDVKEFFIPYDIKIAKVEKKSHKLSARSSFKLSPETKDDYDKILNSDFLPDEVCARKYIFRRGVINTERKEEFQRNGSSHHLSAVTNHLLRELDQMDPMINSGIEEMDSAELTASSNSNENGSTSK